VQQDLQSVLQQEAVQQEASAALGAPDPTTAPTASNVAATKFSIRHLSR
jgi:hypothetical protein